MDSKNVVIRIALIIICVFCSLLAWSSFRKLRNVEFEFNERKANLVKENLDLKDRLESLKEVVNKRMDNLTSAEEERESFDDKLGTLRSENEKITEAYNKLHLDYTTLLTEREEVIRQLVGLKEETLSLAQKISDLENNPIVERMRNAIYTEENEQIRKVLSDALRNIELVKSGRSVDLTPIVVVGSEEEKQQAEEPAPKTDDTKEKADLIKTKVGNILSVSIDSNIVVINIGRRDKIEEGDRCEVLKSGRGIAYGEVLRVRYNISAIYIDEIKYGNFMKDIEEGDKVLFLEFGS